MNLTFRRVYAVTLVAVGLLILTSCGLFGAGTPKSDSLVGTWTASGFEATVDDTSIEITMGDADNRSLYWVGTFQPAATDGDAITSTGDVAQMQESLLGSQDDQKVFTYDDERLVFKMKMFGTARVIRLEHKS